jgi:hypothetical protein
VFTASDTLQRRVRKAVPRAKLKSVEASENEKDWRMARSNKKNLMIATSRKNCNPNEAST